MELPFGLILFRNNSIIKSGKTEIETCVYKISRSTEKIRNLAPLRGDRNTKTVNYSIKRRTDGFCVLSVTDF